MDLKAIKHRIDRLLETQGPPDGPPECVVLLPENGHGPDADDDLPLPRIAWRNSKAACILYDVKAGQPPTADIDRLLAGEGTQQ